MLRRMFSMGSPRLNFGLIADVQFADVDCAKSFDGKETRDYRGSLEHAKLAAARFQELGCMHVVQLGDFVDGKSNPESVPTRGPSGCPPGSRAALAKTLEALRQVPGDAAPPFSLWHVRGNHEFYIAKNSVLKELLPLPKCPSTLAPPEYPDPDLTYYYFQPIPGWRFIFLDGYDVSLAREAGHPAREEALRLLQANNPGNPCAWGQGRGDFFAGVTGPAQRWVPFNGGLGGKQLEWLSGVLKNCRQQGERAFVFSHILLFPDASGPSPAWPCLLFNYPQVLALLGEYKDVVKAVFSGHLHSGAFGLDDAGIAHISLPSPLTHRNGAFAVASLFDDRLEICGSGAAESHCVKF